MTTVSLHSIFCAVIKNIYTKKRKLFNKANYEGMRKEFSDIDWEDKFKDNVNNQWEILKTVLKLIINTYLKKNFQITEMEISP